MEKQNNTLSMVILLLGAGFLVILAMFFQVYKSESQAQQRYEFQSGAGGYLYVFDRQTGAIMRNTQKGSAGPPDFYNWQVVYPTEAVKQK